MQAFFALLSGLIFGIGLILSGMTRPGEVIGFLDLSLISSGGWRWGLIGVMGSAFLTHALLRLLILKRPTSLFGSPFPTFKTTLDRRLLIGAALFGLGWGTAGFCPGPALVSAASGASNALIFVAAMLVGMTAERLWSARVST
jgi:uncharacterized membrane protein YedE/YeeE